MANSPGNDNKPLPRGLMARWHATPLYLRILIACIVGAVLGAGLVDEISQVVVPVVDGGRGIPSLFDIPGDPPRKAAAALRLRSHRRLPGGASWFRYRVV